jgi:hypothetical protein
MRFSVPSFLTSIFASLFAFVTKLYRQWCVAWRLNRRRVMRGWLVILIVFIGIFSPFSASQPLVMSQSVAIEMDVLPVNAFVFSSEAYNFDTNLFLQQQPGPLKNLSITIGSETYSVGQLLSNYATGNSLNPKMLLAYLETSQKLLSNPSASIVNLAGNPDVKGFEPQLQWLVRALSDAFYKYDSSKPGNYTFRDGSKVAVPVGTKAPSFALFSVLASISTNFTTWQSYVTATGYSKIYRAYFGKPVADIITITPQSAHPGLKFPWTAGETWYLTSGPHYDGGGYDPPFNAVDFAPARAYNVAEICTNTLGKVTQRSTKPLRAPHSGKIIASVGYPNYHIILDYNDGSGWQIRLNHVAPTGRVANGVSVNQGDIIGYPSSCGAASGVHTHFVTLQSGILQLINGTIISGWTIRAASCVTGCGYQGWLEKAGWPNVNVNDGVVSDNDGTNNPTLPSTPSNLRITQTLPGEIDLAWDDNSNNATGFKIEHKLGLTGNWVQIATVGAGVTTYHDTGLPQGTTYFYRVQAYNAAGDSGYTNEAVETTTLVSNIVSVAQRQNGLLEVFIRGDDNFLWSRRQQSDGSWTAWQWLNGGLGSVPVVTRNPDGTLEVFIRASANNALYSKKEQLDGSWTDWQFLDGLITGEPALLQNPDGSLEVFVRGIDNSMYSKKRGSNGVWTDWEWLNGGLASAPVVGRNPDGTVEVFIRALEDDALYSKKRNLDGTWDDWIYQAGGLTAAPAVGYNPDGTIEISIRNWDNNLWSKKKNLDGSWNDWQVISNPPGGTTISAPVTAQNNDGTFSVFVIAADKALYTNKKLANGSWEGWKWLDGGLISQPAVIKKADGKMEAFARAVDNALWYVYEKQGGPVNGWTNWYQLYWHPDFNWRVKVSTDKGEQLDGDTVGKLSYALKRTTIGQAVIFDNVTSVAVNGKLPNVQSGVTINGAAISAGGAFIADSSCSTRVILDGLSTPLGTDGLLLGGNNYLYSLQIQHFKGVQIKNVGKGNKLTCTVASKS